MNADLMVGFAAVVVLTFATPGPDWFVVLGSAARGRRAGLLSAAGVLSGLLVHLTAAAVGVSALLLASAEAFTVVKLAGAAYLVFLGLRALQAAWRRRRAPADAGPAEWHEESAPSGSAAWRRAFATNVLNPKAALFFVAVLPQFVDPSLPTLPQILLLGTVDIVLGALWYGAFVVAVSHFREVLRRRRARILLDGGSGVALIGLGTGLALTGRPSSA